MPMSTNEQKLTATLICVMIFIIISLPATYKFTDSIFGGLTSHFIDASGCPTLYGILIHSLVFGIIIYLLQGVKLS
jgi:hypothetical protein